MAFKDAVKHAKGKSKKGMGFKAASESVQKSGKSKEAADAIIASASRNASPAAKAANPNLRKVK